MTSCAFLPGGSGASTSCPRCDDIPRVAHPARFEFLGEPVPPDSFGLAVVVWGHDGIRPSGEDKGIGRGGDEIFDTNTVVFDDAAGEQTETRESEGTQLSYPVISFATLSPDSPLGARTSKCTQILD
jgi:hypothetical protein